MDRISTPRDITAFLINLKTPIHPMIYQLTGSRNMRVVRLAKVCWVLLGPAGSCRVVLGRGGSWWVVVGCAGLCWVVLGRPRSCWVGSGGVVDPSTN